MGEGLIEADAGYIGGLDGCGMVGLVFGEAEGEVLDAVRHAEFFEKQDELAQFFNEPVLIFDRGDGDEQHHVVGEVVEAVRVRDDDERWCEYRVLREDACAVGVVLIAEFCCPGAVVFGKILLDVGEGCAEATVAYDRKIGRRFGIWCHWLCWCSLAAEDGFHTGEELVEVGGFFAVSLDGFATAHRAMPDMRFKLTREYFVFHRLDFFVGVLGIEFVDFFFEALLLVEGVSGFLHTVFVCLYLLFDLLDALRVAEPALDAVQPLGVDAAVHQYVVILDVGDASLFDTRLLPDESGSGEDKGEHREEHGEIYLPRFTGDADGLLNLLYRSIGGEVVDLFRDFGLEIINRSSQIVSYFFDGCSLCLY